MTLLDFLACRWPGVSAFLGIVWAFGWFDLRFRGAERPALVSGLLAVTFTVTAIWLWRQEPMFFGSRWVALAPILCWVGLVRLAGLRRLRRLRGPRRLG